MTIREALRNSFPFTVSNGTLDVIAVSRGLSIEDLFDTEVASNRQYELAKADVIKSVVMSPNISEGGVSISFSERQYMISVANEIYERYGEALLGQATPTVKALDW